MLTKRPLLTRVWPGRIDLLRNILLCFVTPLLKPPYSPLLFAIAPPATKRLTYALVV